ncbi:MAG: hypothetical protein NTW86_14360 [Candidatus Sumerlaeota bacterium]|nr:hypothetical protein [Candidatus Sumerlaeota bacterium]
MSVKPAPDSDFRIHVLLHLPLLALLVLGFAMPWLDAGLPPEDFPANAAWFDDISRWTLAGDLGQWWAPQWLMGVPRTLVFSKILAYWIPLPFRALGNAAKMGTVTYFAGRGCSERLKPLTAK